jgi:dethiobiotin synthetase
MTAKSYFITGTDTGVGKTWVTLTLMHYFKQQGYSVVGMKPVAAGCQCNGQQLKNEDALLIQEHCSMSLQYKEINPYAFKLPVSPHLAAEENNVEIDVIVEAFQKLTEKAEIVIVEGAGGWLAPINREKDVADLVKALLIPVILVVAIKLGCINHARLSVQKIQSDGIKVSGWIAVCLDSNMLLIEENIASIAAKIRVPLLGVFPYCKVLNLDTLASNLKIANQNSLPDLSPFGQ